MSMLDVRGVSKSFAALQAVNNVSLKVESGEIYGLLGPNGAGKTTTISMISGLLRPDAGKITVGCALLHRPKLLLLDEPTVGIDPQARSNILELVKNLSRDGTSILYTTHYLEEAEQLCQRIGIIDHGQLLAEGTLPDLQKRLG